VSLLFKNDQYNFSFGRKMLRERIISSSFQKKNPFVGNLKYFGRLERWNRMLKKVFQNDENDF